jgi:hypothetical protein
VIFAVIRGVHRRQVFFPRPWRIWCRCIGIIRAFPIARYATDTLADTGNADSAARANSDPRTAQSQADTAALAMPMRPIDFSREIAKTATDTTDIHI